MGDDGGSGQREEERRGVHAGRARFPERSVHDLLEVGPDAETAEAFGEVDPCEAVVVLVTSELDAVLDRWIVVSQEVGERVLDLLELGFRGDQL